VFKLDTVVAAGALCTNWDLHFLHLDRSHLQCPRLHRQEQQAHFVLPYALLLCAASAPLLFMIYMHIGAHEDTPGLAMAHTRTPGTTTRGCNLVECGSSRAYGRRCTWAASTSCQTLQSVVCGPAQWWVTSKVQRNARPGACVCRKELLLHKTYTMLCAAWKGPDLLYLSIMSTIIYACTRVHDCIRTQITLMMCVPVCAHKEWRT